MHTVAVPRRVVSAPLPAYKPVSLMADFAGLARRLRRSVPSLSPSERMFLNDLTRDRYRMQALQNLIAIAARSDNPAHRFNACEIVRAHIVRQSVPFTLFSVIDSGDYEDDTNASLDKAMRRYVSDRTQANRAAAIEAAEAQLAATRRMLDALYADKAVRS